jgi:hypothetical protein
MYVVIMDNVKGDLANDTSHLDKKQAEASSLKGAVAILHANKLASVI